MPADPQTPPTPTDWKVSGVRVVGADQLDPNLFVQVHRATIVNMRAVATAERDFTGRVMLTLKGVKDKVQVSRQYAHLFARM